MKFQTLAEYPYTARRPVVMGTKGAVATGQPLAAMAGMEILVAGGNAVDAAIAMAITLTVVEPTSNGIGADAFALVWDGKLNGLNASGKSPKYFPPEIFQDMTCIPVCDWRSVTVPGAVSGWRSLWERWGKLSFGQLFTPAIRYAEFGYPVSPQVSLAWKKSEEKYLPLISKEFIPFKEIFFPNNRAPKAGEIWSSQIIANTLKEIAETGGESFYQGKLAEKIANFAANTGGFITQEDLATHQPQWVNPISTNYRGLTVWEMPPNTQGIAALIALNILSGFDMAAYPRDSVESYHLQIESMKLAFADLHRYISDEAFLEISIQDLLSLEYAVQRRALIKQQAQKLVNPGLAKDGTVYLAAADGDLMVSFIQSNFSGFGSGIVPEGTGIALQNRASGFSLEKGHPNQVAPNKRPFHTIIPGFLTQDNQPLGVFGVMGGDMQAQGHVQVVVNMADYLMNPQTALDAPRWRYLFDNTVKLEPKLDSVVNEQILQGLLQRGHNVSLDNQTFFGRGQIICQQDNVLIAASESRTDGLAIAW
jgi:gamma-glutamyltranspeptidase / glutathione hydrolase